MGVAQDSTQPDAPEPDLQPPWFVYLVRCSDSSLYTGIALDVERRFAQHQSGVRGAKFLRGRGPLELAFQGQVKDRSTALRVEYALKRWSKARKEALVLGQASFDELVASTALQPPGGPR